MALHTRTSVLTEPTSYRVTCSVWSQLLLLNLFGPQSGMSSNQRASGEHQAPERCRLRPLDMPYTSRSWVGGKQNKPPRSGAVTHTSEGLGFFWHFQHNTDFVDMLTLKLSFGGIRTKRRKCNKSYMRAHLADLFFRCLSSRVELCHEGWRRRGYRLCGAPRTKLSSSWSAVPCVFRVDVLLYER